MKTLRFLLALICLATMTNAQAVDSTEIKFKKVLAEGGMTFTMPGGSVAVPILKNMQMHYEYAIKYPNKAIEIRYSVAPYSNLRNALIKFQKAGDTTEAFNKKLDQMSKINVLAIAQNVGGTGHDTTIRFRSYPTEALKKDFNANWGGAAFINVKNTSFATDYKFCMMVFLHKDNAGDAYIMYLGDNARELSDLVKDTVVPVGGFNALRFKDQ
jgi:hypothetical protein